MAFMARFGSGLRASAKARSRTWPRTPRTASALTAYVRSLRARVSGTRFVVSAASIGLSTSNGEYGHAVTSGSRSQSCAAVISTSWKSQGFPGPYSARFCKILTGCSG